MFDFFVWEAIPFLNHSFCCFDLQNSTLIIC